MRVGIVGLLLELVGVRALGVVLVVVGVVLGLVVVTDVDLDVERLEVLGIVAVLAVLVILVVVLLVGDRDGLRLVVHLVVVDGEHRDRGCDDRAAVDALGIGEQRGERARERVDLVRVQRRAVGELGLVVGQHALETEHERIAPAPFR